MRISFAILAITHWCLSFGQTNKLVEIKDFRPDRDSLIITKVLSHEIDLTSKFICRNFDFCSPIKDKLWLTLYIPNEKATLSPRTDRSQLVIERDFKGRLISKVYYSCLDCLPDSYGYTFSYDSTGNEVTMVELTAEDIMLLRQGLAPNTENVKSRITTFTRFNNEGFIRSLRTSLGEDLIFSITVLK